jgi:glyceraldehyde-3-phosphate dehydrogenase/erythrose-4-phosphate dehydrogenase
MTTELEQKEKKFEVKEGHLFRIGRYTIVRIVDDSGIESVGVARVSDIDKYNRDLSYRIALGRAQKAAEMKSKNKSIHHNFMG